MSVDLEETKLGLEGEKLWGPKAAHAALDIIEVREFFIANLLVRIHFSIETIWWTGFVPWEFETPFLGSLLSTLLDPKRSGQAMDVMIWRMPDGKLVPSFSSLLHSSSELSDTVSLKYEPSLEPLHISAE